MNNSNWNNEKNDSIKVFVVFNLFQAWFLFINGVWAFDLCFCLCLLKHDSK